MEMPNAICIVGNHELMALECLKFLMQEVTEESLAGRDYLLVHAGLGNFYPEQDIENS